MLLLPFANSISVFFCVTVLTQFILALLLHKQEFSGSYVGVETSIMLEVLCDFLNSLQENAGIITEIRP